MFPKNYTTKGKIIIGIYLISLLTIVIISGSYVVSYMSNKEVLATEDTPSVEVNSTDSNQIEETTNSTESASDTANTDTTVNNETNNETGEAGQNEMGNVVSNDSEVATESDSVTAEPTTPSGNENGTYSQEDLKILKEAYAILYFDFQSFELNETSNEILESFLKVANEYPDEYIVIEGHSDGFPNFENTSMESELSSNRISAVLDELIANGLDKSKIITVNSGSSDPASKKADERNKNDRVEIYFVDHVMKNTNGK